MSVAVVQVALHGGAPNKNIGDAFLLVWKFPKGCTVEDIARVTSVPDATEHEASALSSNLLDHSLRWWQHVLAFQMYTQHQKTYNVCHAGVTRTHSVYAAVAFSVHELYYWQKFMADLCHWCRASMVQAGCIKTQNRIGRFERWLTEL